MAEQKADSNKAVPKFCALANHAFAEVLKRKTACEIGMAKARLNKDRPQV